MSAGTNSIFGYDLPIEDVLCTRHGHEVDCPFVVEFASKTIFLSNYCYAVFGNISNDLQKIDDFGFSKIPQGLIEKTSAGTDPNIRSECHEVY